MAGLKRADPAAFIWDPSRAPTYIFIRLSARMGPVKRFSCASRRLARVSLHFGVFRSTPTRVQLRAGACACTRSFYFEILHLSKVRACATASASVRDRVKYVVIAREGARKKRFYFSRVEWTP